MDLSNAGAGRKRKFSEIGETTDDREVKSTRVLRSDVQKICHIDKLPNEVLEKIFGYFDARARKKFSLVSKKWLDVAFSYPFAKDYPLELPPFSYYLTRLRPMFIKTNYFRRFPCVRIRNIPMHLIKNEEYLSLLSEIGRGTTHLWMHSLDQAIFVLHHFPKLTTLHVEQVESWVDPEVLDKIKSLKELKNLCCKTLIIIEREGKVPLFEVPAELKAFYDKDSIIKLRGSSNLLSGYPIDFEDVTEIIVDKNFEQLPKFTNLKVNEKHGN